MAYQPIEKLLPQSNGSIYKLILLASQRALELTEGSPRLIEYPSTQKPATIALEEILAKKVVLDTGKKKE
jgi:DNA-directed RNA polymerase omega subunit